MLTKQRSTLLALAAVLACRSEPTAPEIRLARGANPLNPEIAYVKADGIWVANADGSSAGRVVANSAARNPTWSPLGHGTNAAPYELAYDVGNAIYKVRITLSSGLQSSAPILVVAAGSGGSVPFRTAHPDFAPDGSEIVFAENAIGQRQALWTVAAGGGSAQMIYAPGAPRTVARPSWSWDGSRIAYIEDDDEFGVYVNRAIMMIRRDGGTASGWTATADTVLPTGQTPLASLDWARQADSLVFGGQDIYVYDLNQPKMLPPSVLTGAGPAWSPGNDRIVFYTPFPAKLAVHTFASGQTAILASKVTGSRAAWR